MSRFGTCSGLSPRKGGLLMEPYEKILAGFARQEGDTPRPLSRYDQVLAGLFQAAFALGPPPGRFFLLRNQDNTVISASPGSGPLIGSSPEPGEILALCAPLGFVRGNASFQGEHPFVVEAYGAAGIEFSPAGTHGAAGDPGASGTSGASGLREDCLAIGGRIQLLAEPQLKYLKRIDFVFKAFDSIEDYAITVVDENAIVRFANKTNADILKVDYSLLQEFIEKEMDMLDKSSSILYRVLRTGEKEIRRHHVYMLNGKPIYQDNTAYPIRDGDGKVIGSVDIFTSRDNKKTPRIVPPPNSWTPPSAALPAMVGKSPQLAKILETAAGYARYSHCVLILGESGTGKEMAAHYIHGAGPRAGMPFVTLNCANLMDTLIDSELFGYEEGAYTGSAKGGKKGKFQLADGGTLFLDEVGELPLHLQAKLLRAIETKRINRLGSEESIPVDVRIIAATNRSLSQMVKSGTFREDLYYRLNVLSMELPPLRERKSDIPLFVLHFLEKYQVPESRRAAMGDLLNDEIQNYLADYDWPGNIRELENLIIRFIVLSEKQDTHLVDLIEGSGNAPPTGGTPPPLRREAYISREELSQVLDKCRGNKREAARLLGVGRSTLYRYMTKYGL